jgi:hypothetical protein
MTFDKKYYLYSEQLESFEKNGYLMLPDVLTPFEVEEMQQWAAEVKGWPNRPGEHMPYEEVRADGTTGLCRTESESVILGDRSPHQSVASTTPPPSTPLVHTPAISPHTGEL